MLLMLLLFFETWLAHSETWTSIEFGEKNTCANHGTGFTGKSYVLSKMMFALSFLTCLKNFLFTTLQSLCSCSPLSGLCPGQPSHPSTTYPLWQLWGSGSAEAWAIETLNSFPDWFLQPCLADCFSCIYWGPMLKVALSLVFSPALSPWQTLDLLCSLVSRCLLLLLSGIYFHFLHCFDSQYHWSSPAEMLQGCVLLARSLSVLWPYLAHSLQSPPRAACKSWEHWWTWLPLSGLH